MSLLLLFIVTFLVLFFSEKERDAYSAAYEASLQHFEKWTKSKS